MYLHTHTHTDRYIYIYIHVHRHIYPIIFLSKFKISIFVCQGLPFSPNEVEGDLCLQYGRLADAFNAFGKALKLREPRTARQGQPRLCQGFIQGYRDFFGGITDFCLDVFGNYCFFFGCFWELLFFLDVFGNHWIFGWFSGTIHPINIWYHIVNICEEASEKKGSCWCHISRNAQALAGYLRLPMFGGVRGFGMSGRNTKGVWLSLVECALNTKLQRGTKTMLVT